MGTLTKIITSLIVEYYLGIPVLVKRIWLWMQNYYLMIILYAIKIIIIVYTTFVRDIIFIKHLISVLNLNIINTYTFDNSSYLLDKFFCSVNTIVW